MLVKTGYKEIDISFPSASDTEHNFTRKVVETPEAVPDDVWIQVLSPCRKDLIYRTIQSVTGAKKVILSLYIATSDTFLDTVFGLSQQQILESAVECVAYARSLTKDESSQSQTEWNLMFSPEAFSDTDVAYSSKICEAGKTAWGPTAENPMILNLPATVEMSTPNVYADQVEMFCNSITEIEKVCVSLHPHNDRGCAVAAAELGLMAGAGRVEGCLFGNGERTGNVDLITLALNLYTQGIDPRLDFSDLSSTKALFEECTQIPIPLRMPYSGDAVFVAYSGSHQDAINKGFKKMKGEKEKGNQSWKIPYLALDPHDIGMSYESVIRVNSQSGKGGVAWTLDRAIHLDMPRGLQIAFSKVVNAETDFRSRTLSPAEITSLFFKTYHILGSDARVLSATYGANGRPCLLTVDAMVSVNGDVRALSGNGDDILSAVQDAIRLQYCRSLSFKRHERTLRLESGKTGHLILIECTLLDNGMVSWGASVSKDSNVNQANLLACLSSAMVSSFLPAS